jgi:hypothetical protein
MKIFTISRLVCAGMTLATFTFCGTILEARERPGRDDHPQRKNHRPEKMDKREMEKRMKEHREKQQEMMKKRQEHQQQHGPRDFSEYIQQRSEGGMRGAQLDEAIREKMAMKGIHLKNEHKGMGDFVQKKLAEGKRGPELAAAIREEFGRRHIRDPFVNARQDNQHDRIAHGVGNGQLTREEFKDVAGTQKDIRQQEREYKSDGTFTKDERKDIHQEMNQASKAIYQEKHDAETRGGVPPAEPKKPGTHSPGVNARRDSQEDRIIHGILSGELTRKETLSLAQKEARLASIEKKMKQDGSLTVEERARLNQYLTELSVEIYEEKHDAQSRN